VELALARAAAEEGVFLMADIMVKKSCWVIELLWLVEKRDWWEKDSQPHGHLIHPSWTIPNQWQNSLLSNSSLLHACRKESSCWPHDDLKVNSCPPHCFHPVSYNSNFPWSHSFIWHMFHIYIPPIFCIPLISVQWTLCFAHAKGLIRGLTHCPNLSWWFLALPNLGYWGGV
jgi:hypothetical protein